VPFDDCSDGKYARKGIVNAGRKEWWFHDEAIKRQITIGEANVITLRIEMDRVSSGT
jgi:hypothetical protein